MNMRAGGRPPPYAQMPFCPKFYDLFSLYDLMFQDRQHAAARNHIKNTFCPAYGSNITVQYSLLNRLK
jgi:hypothetical protein